MPDPKVNIGDKVKCPDGDGTVYKVIEEMLYINLDRGPIARFNVGDIVLLPGKHHKAEHIEETEPVAKKLGRPKKTAV